jgi:membrane-associated phospholipid phosphatase
MKQQSYRRAFLGLHLVAGFIIFAMMTLTLWQISEVINKREPLTIADTQLSTWLHSRTLPWLTSAMFVVTSLGSSLFASCIAVVFGLYLIRRRRFYWLAAFLSSVYGGMLLNRILKYVFQRPRPHFDDPLLSLTSYSFPSGHTMTATVLFGVLAAYFFNTTQGWRRRVAIIFVGSFLILLVGFSRIYLGAHYLTDVLGAMAEGLAWLALCLTLVYSLWRQRH